MKLKLNSISRFALALSSAFAMIWTSGCASYQLGSPAELKFESIYIQPTQNASFAPQAQTVVSTQIRKAFIQDGRIAIVSDPSEADAILEVTLTDYTRTGGARQSNDTIVARSFDINLLAEISLYNQNDGEYYFSKRQLSESSNAYVENPYTTSNVNTESYIASEYDAMSRIARDIARKITDEVLSPWPAQSATDAIED